MSQQPVLDHAQLVRNVERGWDLAWERNAAQYQEILDSLTEASLQSKRGISFSLAPNSWQPDVDVLRYKLGDKFRCTEKYGVATSKDERGNVVRIRHIQITF